MRRVIALALLVAASVLTVAVPASAVDFDYDYTVAHDASAGGFEGGTNSEAFWEKHFADAGKTNVSCTKYGEDHNGFVPGSYEAGIIKAGQTNYVWLLPGDEGKTLAAPQDLSHIFKCDFDTPPDPPQAEPFAAVGATCVDRNGDGYRETARIRYRWDTDGETLSLFRRAKVGAIVRTFGPVEVNGQGSRRFGRAIGADTVRIRGVIKLGTLTRVVDRSIRCEEPPRPASAAILGPVGDPWFRFVVRNPLGNDTLTSVFRFIGDDGVTKVTKNVPDGCVFRSGWRYVLPDTQMWVNGDGKRLTTRDAGPGGYYGPIPDIANKGLTCVS